jgi:hypothetical protein
LYDNTVSCKMLKIGSNIRIGRLNRNQHGQVDFSRLDCNKWVLIFLIYLQNTWWLFLSKENLLYQIKKKYYRDALVHNIPCVVYSTCFFNNRGQYIIAYTNKNAFQCELRSKVTSVKRSELSINFHHYFLSSYQM